MLIRQLHHAHNTILASKEMGTTMKQCHYSSPRLYRLFFFCLCLSQVETIVGSSNLRKSAQTTTRIANDGPRPFDTFPSLATVAEMANLSHWVYQYKHNKDGDECEKWNNSTEHVKCHWYLHDTGLGTQVMIVSSVSKDYLAVVFAGTDDLKTSLVDVDIRKIEFGTGDYDRAAENVSKIPVSLPCNGCKVHAGFNNAVFSNHIFDDIYSRIESLRPKFKRLYTTGHSLGAADSVLSALAMALQFQKHMSSPMKYPVTSINFGCPQVGNEEFQDYVHTNWLTHRNGTHQDPYLEIWRFVLGWDLIPRLPEFFYHVGHTVQMHHPECNDFMAYCNYFYNHEHGAVAEEEYTTWEYYQAYNKDHAKVVKTTMTTRYWWWDRNKEQGDRDSGDSSSRSHSYFPWHHHNNDYKDSNDDNFTHSAQSYYHHIGNETLHYAGVPSGWSSRPYLWVPGALWSHAMRRYAQFFNDWLSNVTSQPWVQDFAAEDTNPSNSSDKLIDDDTYNEPPDDDAAAAEIRTLVTREKAEVSSGTNTLQRFQRELFQMWRGLQ